MHRVAGGLLALLIAATASLVTSVACARGAVTRDQVENAIRGGVKFLHDQQAKDGSWPGQAGMTGLATLALLTAGEPADSLHVARGLANLMQTSPVELNNTYAIALQTMAFAAADPVGFKPQIGQNVAWLEQAQLKSMGGGPAARGRPGRVGVAVGAWSYAMGHGQSPDNSNSQYALLGLHAASEAGLPVSRDVWTMARNYWEVCQQRDGGWGYKASGTPETGSMSCAGISSLIITGLRRYQGHEILVGDAVQHCGEGHLDPHLQAGIEWLGAHFRVLENPNSGGQWRYYYLYGLERAGRLTGQRFFGGHDWYREGAEALVREQNQFNGGWQSGGDSSPVVSTSFALLFLSKGRAPVLINKLRHGPGADWNNDPDDVRNLVDLVSRDWKHLLTWQMVDPNFASVEDLLQAPILFLNGHEAPLFSEPAKRNLREYVQQGGFLFAEACCGRTEFDRGFRALMAELFPDPEYELHPLPDDHPVWRTRHRLLAEITPLWGIEHGCRTVVIYSPSDLSCFWNQMERQGSNPSVVKAQRVGQNVVDYVTGREMPADKLDPREVTRLKIEPAKRGALHIAKLRHAGDWNVAPLAIPNLTTALRDKLGFDVVINHREIFPADPNLVHFPLIYLHGRAALSFTEDDLSNLRRHLEPGGGTIFADAACGSPAFDASFRRFVAELLPKYTLVPIPADDDLYTQQVGYDLSNVQFTKAAGGERGRPQLEGVKINGHWAIIYSKLDIGCALEHDQGVSCKGYDHDSAIKIAANIVIYSTLP
jgi:hypothetical protein